MSGTYRLMSRNANTAMSQISLSAMEKASRSALVARVTKNTRALSSFPSPLDAMNVADNQKSATTNPIQRHHKIHSLKKGNIRMNMVDKKFLQRRSMVTITQTKSSDIAPLYSSHIADDVSASSSDSPTYIVNEGVNLIVTESCLNQVERLLRQRRAKAEQPEDFDDGYFLRVYVDAGGCSGFQYKFELKYETPSDEESLIDPQDDVVITASLRDGSLVTRVVIDDASLDLLRGSKVDFIQEMIRSSFAVVENPQSESACGCGSSFAVKNFESNPALD